MEMGDSELVMFDDDDGLCQPAPDQPMPAIGLDETSLDLASLSVNSQPVRQISWPELFSHIRT
jgi:hypothetical protein